MFSNVKRELQVDEENDKYAISVSRKRRISATVDKTFVCVTCHKAFTRRGALKIHRQVHTGNKPYVCVTCHKRFTRNSSLRMHQRVHSGDKPFVCITCHRGFTPFKPEFTIVIFIHYKPRIAVAILDL